MFRVLGETGPAVLLLPGGAEDVGGFYPGLPEALLADPGCRVVLYDRPGTPASGVEGRLADASDAIHGELVAHGIGPVVVVGQSLGGAIALLLARDHAESVAGLVLLDPSFVNDVELARKTEQNAALFARIARFGVGRRLLRSMLRRSVRRSAERHGMSAQARAAALTIADTDIARLARAADGLADLAREFDPSRLRPVPAVVVTADRAPDSAMHRAHARLADALDAPLVSWPRAEHQVHLTHEHEVIVTTRRFVRGLVHGER